MPDALDAAFAEIKDKARAFALDSYLASLRAPLFARADLLTLAAFRGEISRVPLEIADAALAEIKLQWWRDVISQGVFGARSGNPVADALVDLLTRHKLSHEVALRYIDGVARELYEDGIEDEEALTAYAHETEGALSALALGALGASDGSRAAADAFAASSAEALALTRLALTLPIHMARGRLPVPVSWRAEFGDPRGADGHVASGRARLIVARLADRARGALHAARLSQGPVVKSNFAAFLGLVLVEPYLRVLARPGHDAVREVADISPITRVVRILVASWRSRI